MSPSHVRATPAFKFGLPNAARPEPVPGPTSGKLSKVRELLEQRSTGGAMDRGFRILVILCALSIMATVVLIVFELWTESKLSRQTFGWSFFTSTDWDPVSGLFGAKPFIYGTLVSSLLALAMAVPLGVGVAVYMTEICP